MRSDSPEQPAETGTGNRQPDGAAGGGWGVYLLRCADGTYYCGVTNDLPARLKAHNEGKTGAKYTRGRRPVELLAFSGALFGKGQALRLEREIKRQRREKKAGYLNAAAGEVLRRRREEGGGR